jgi:hypothetical protein
MFPYCQLCDSARRHTGEQLSAAYDGQTFTAPRHPEDLNSFTSVTLTDISGHARPLGDWTHFEPIMTSDGTGNGNTEIPPARFLSTVNRSVSP